nr:LUD domain-containing protein [Streptococcus anginosus]
DAVVTRCRVAISLSGTIVLDGEPDQGRRAITLVPDTHVVVLRASDIVPTVPQAVDILGKNPTRPMTWLAGGSATSD